MVRQQLDPSKVPTAVVPLLPLAERWGEGDDGLREQMVDAASDGELRAMVLAVDAVDDASLYGWLAGPESYRSPPSAEYVAITNLTMAADSARVVLRQRGYQL
jgi:hypothetical protein